MKDREVARAELLERLRFQVAFAQGGLRALMLINGGAIIALFTLIGSGAVALDTGRLWGAFAAFVIGLVAVLLACLGAFVSQGCYYQVTAIELDGGEVARLAPFARGQRAEIAGLCAALTSLGCFVIGAGIALSAVA